MKLPALLENKLEVYKKESRKYYRSKPFFLIRAFTFIDCILQRLFFHIEPLEYFQYSFPKKSLKRRQTFLTYYHLRQMIRSLNSSAQRSTFDDKAEFCRCFDNLLGRDWLDMKLATVDEFSQFAANHPTFFTKDSLSMFGKGVHLVHVSDDPRVNLFETLRDHSLLLEEPIVQHSQLSLINKSSVNTVRVVTLLDSLTKPHVVACVLRVGRQGLPVDNFHFGGIAAAIDTTTGQVYSSGVDSQFRRYTVHPDSGLPILGFTIPNWNAVIDLVQKAALRVPSVRYVGWDIAITENSAVLVEGNYGPDPDVTQMPQDTGLLPLMNQLLKL